MPAGRASSRAMIHRSPRQHCRRADPQERHWQWLARPRHRLEGRRSLAAQPPGVDPGPPRLVRVSFDRLRSFAEVRRLADAALRPDAPSPFAIVLDPCRRYAPVAPAAAAERLRLGLPRRRAEPVHALRPDRRPEPDLPASVPG